MSLLDVLRGVMLDPAERAAYSADPSAYLERYGYDDVDPADLSEAFGLVADTLPPAQAQAAWAAAGTGPFGDLDGDGRLDTPHLDAADLDAPDLDRAGDVEVADHGTDRDGFDAVPDHDGLLSFGLGEPAPVDHAEGPFAGHGHLGTLDDDADGTDLDLDDGPDDGMLDDPSPFASHGAFDHHDVFDNHDPLGHDLDHDGDDDGGADDGGGDDLDDFDQLDGYGSLDDDGPDIGSF